MLNDLLSLFRSVIGKLMRVNLYVMAFDKISSARRRKSAVKAGLVPERHAEAAERHPLNPLLQLFIAHTGHSVLPQVLSTENNVST
ncbi:hypothetical protein D3C73_1213090 [compost metagenome]